MNLTKTQRLAVRNRFGGCCSYCGNPLPDTGWHADHVLCVRRVSEFALDGKGDVFSGIQDRRLPLSVARMVAGPVVVKWTTVVASGMGGPAASTRGAVTDGASVHAGGRRVCGG